MGKCSRTNGIRIKRPGLETIKQRRKRQLREADEVTVNELRVVRKRELSPRSPAGLPAKVPAWEKKLKALLKLNKDINALRSRQDNGEDLNDQQLRKVQRRDDILLQIDTILSEHPEAADRFGFS